MEYEKGMEKGIEQGRKDANLQTAQKLLLTGSKISFVVEITDLPKEKVEKLKQEMIKSGQLEEGEMKQPDDKSQ